MQLKSHEIRQHPLKHCLIELLKSNKVIKSDFSNLPKIALLYKLLLHFLCKIDSFCTDFEIHSEKFIPKINYKGYLIQDTLITISLRKNFYENTSNSIYGIALTGYAPPKNFKIVTFDYLIRLIDRLAKIHSINFKK